MALGIQTRKIPAGGTCILGAPGRLVAVAGTITNRTHTFSDTDYVETTEPFVDGPVASTSGATAYFRF